MLMSASFQGSRYCRQVAPAHQVVSCSREGEDPAPPVLVLSSGFSGDYQFSAPGNGLHLGIAFSRSAVLVVRQGGANRPGGFP